MTACFACACVHSGAALVGNVQYAHESTKVKFFINVAHRFSSDLGGVSFVKYLLIGEAIGPASCNFALARVVCANGDIDLKVLRGIWKNPSSCKMRLRMYGHCDGNHGRIGGAGREESVPDKCSGIISSVARISTGPKRLSGLPKEFLSFGSWLNMGSPLLPSFLGSAV